MRLILPEPSTENTMPALYVPHGYSPVDRHGGSPAPTAIFSGEDGANYPSDRQGEVSVFNIHYSSEGDGG